MASARDATLGRIRAALGRSGPLASAQADALRDGMRAHVAGPRPASGGVPLERFRERALALASTVDEVAMRDAVPAAVARYLAANGLPAEAVIWPELGGLDWAGAGITAHARAARGTDLVGITGAWCAVAETGTLLLLSGSETPATVSLLPETHVAVVPAARIVPGLEDAWALLRSEHGESPRAINLVSGPSRTADIEQTIVLGAHGPYRVHVVVVQGEPWESRSR